MIPDLLALRIDEKHSAPDKSAISVSPEAIFSDKMFIRYWGVLPPVGPLKVLASTILNLFASDCGGLV